MTNENGLATTYSEVVAGTGRGWGTGMRGIESGNRIWKQITGILGEKDARIDWPPLLERRQRVHELGGAAKSRQEEKLDRVEHMGDEHPQDDDHDCQTYGSQHSAFARRGLYEQQPTDAARHALVPFPPARNASPSRRSEQEGLGYYYYYI